MIVNPFIKQWDSRKIPGYISDFDTRFNLTNDGTGLASQWDERYSNGMSFSQATQSKRPAITSNYFGGAPSLSGNVSNAVLMTGNSSTLTLFKNLSGYTIYALWRPGNGNNEDLITATTNNGSGARATLGTGSRVTQGAARKTDAGGGAVVSGPFADLPYLWATNFQVDLSNTLGTMYRSNVLVGKNSSFLSVGSTDNTNSQGVALFALTSGVSGFFIGELVRLIICSGAHSDSVRAASWQQIINEYSSSIPVMGSSPSMLVQMHGDSITQGSALTSGMLSLPDLIWQSLGSSFQKAVVNIGKSGSKIGDLTTDRPNLVDIVPVSIATKVIYVCQIGLNDILAGTSGSTVYTSIKTNFQSAKTARPGIKVIICTPIANGSATAGQRTELVNLRNSINTNAIADGADAVCDLGALTQFLTSSSTLPNDTTYYNADKTHPTNSGNLILASSLATSINSV